MADPADRYTNFKNYDPETGRPMAETPKPAPDVIYLRKMAEWFDSPNQSPAIAVQPSPVHCLRYTPGYLLRLIADELEAMQPSAPEEGASDVRAASECPGCEEGRERGEKQDHVARRLFSDSIKLALDQPVAHKYIGERARGGGVTPTCICGWRGFPQLGGYAKDQWEDHVLSLTTSTDTGHTKEGS